MLHFTWCIEWVGVHHFQTGFQTAKERDGILQQVRRHNREAIAGFQSSTLQVGTKLRGEPVDLGEGQGLAHQREGGFVAVPFSSILDHVDERREGVGINLSRHPLRVVLQPRLRCCCRLHVLLFGVGAS